MPSDIVLPNLTQWTKNAITAIYQAKTSQELNTVLDHFFTKDAKIVNNGVHQTIEQYKQQVFGEELAEASAQVQFDNTVEVEKSKDTGSLAGSVGAFYVAKLVRKALVHDAPIVSVMSASLNVVIVQDESLPAPHEPFGIHGVPFDRRRVAYFSQVFNFKTDL